jgi:DNA-binding transcriptional ArsR family regulator
MTNSNALAVCADPTRQAVLTALRHGPRSVGEIADGLPVSQSAVSQHLRVLREAGLVRAQAAGTRRLYSVDLDGLGELRAWFDRFWDDALEAFTHHVERTHPAGQTASTQEETP